MRLKTFHAKSLTDAMLLVREQLGDDAIIVSTHDAEGTATARVIAAVDQVEDDFAAPDMREELAEQITAALERHGAPPELTDRLVNESAMVDENDPIKALAHALDEFFSFDPIDVAPPATALMLIGPPGTGKTVTCAKLAAAGVLQATGRSDSDELANTAPVSLVAADRLRLGGFEQLHLYAERIGARIISVQNSSAMHAVISERRPDELIIIDTAGINPFNLEDVADIVELADAEGAGREGAIEPILVLGAGRDYVEAADMAQAFRPIGPKRLLITGFDLARRLGSMLAAADAAQLSFSNMSRSPNIADKPAPLDAMALARLLINNVPRETA